MFERLNQLSPIQLIQSRLDQKVQQTGGGSKR